VAEGRFREDLYYRLRVISVHMPPLRARLEDVGALVDYFVGRFVEEYGKPMRYVSDQVIRKIQSYSRPGNVRELENSLRRAVIVCKGDVLLPDHLAFETKADGNNADSDPVRELKQRLEELAPQILRLGDQHAHANLVELVEESIIAGALKQCSYNQVHAARLLGISRNTLRHRMQKYKLEPPAE
jgi:DNA-binding NtrC family response regulator